MFDLITGCVIGALASLVIAHAYYKRASRDLNIAISKLQNLADEIKHTSDEIYNDVNISKKHIVRGTIDDPEFPYK